jgi:peroxiredoxin
MCYSIFGHPGPCRKENPNVVKLYNKYKTSGFEILGISLDQNRERWLQAIQADKLTWKHTSDLKGWSNEVSKLYEISAIPKTFLVDPNGMIIARDLRGAELERKLAEIFTEKSTQGGK